jgi:hypothetical protein
MSVSVSGRGPPIHPHGTSLGVFRYRVEAHRVILPGSDSKTKKEKPLTRAAQNFRAAARGNVCAGVTVDAVLLRYDHGCLGPGGGAPGRVRR